MATRQFPGKETELVDIHHWAGLLHPRLWDRASQTIRTGNALCCPCLLTVTLTQSWQGTASAYAPCCPPTDGLTFRLMSLLPTFERKDGPTLIESLQTEGRGYDWQMKVKRKAGKTEEEECHILPVSEQRGERMRPSHDADNFLKITSLHRAWENHLI